MRVLFQGDSITDAGRDRMDITSLGAGYAAIAAEYLRAEFPNTDFTFINRGISGNKVDDLKERWAQDAVDIRPDILSVMIGINDVWHYIDKKEKMNDDYFEDCYAHILSEIKRQRDVKIIILEPFLIYTPDKESIRQDLDRKIARVRKIARTYGDVYVPLDGIFAAALLDKPSEFWAWDGVHPTPEGAELIAAHYKEAIKKVL